MKNYQKRMIYICLPLILFALFTMVDARDRNNSKKTNLDPVEAQWLSRPAIGEDDQPVRTDISWVGTGRFGTFTITNFGENGYFEPPPGWQGYTGEFPSGLFTGNGNTGEFPRLSGQYYVWDAGLWVGAKVATQFGDSTIYEPRVAACAYYSDLGTLSPLYQTNQKIPEGEDGEGDFLFKQRGIDPSEMAGYQELWQYADTTINAKRRAAGHPELQLSTANGDILSNEDTYTVYGDYWNIQEAIGSFSPLYEPLPVGVRIEQRTYSWSADSYIYLNYLITNMNAFTLYDVYFGYFMDNDIGDSNDDLIGYDEDLNLGYSYDSDLQEAGWKTLAGYVGTVFLKTPNGSDGQELGLTGFQTWTREGTEQDVDNRDRDDLKYEQLVKTTFEVFSEPQDVRQLTCSGPVDSLVSGETVEVTLLVVAGGSLDEIRRNTVAALDRYNSGYIGPEAPPSPKLTAIPANERVLLSWDKFPETIPD